MNLCFIALRLTFGGAPNPNIWSDLSESITDLANALLQCQAWNFVLMGDVGQNMSATPLLMFNGEVSGKVEGCIWCVLQ